MVTKKTAPAKKTPAKKPVALNSKKAVTPAPPMEGEGGGIPKRVIWIVAILALVGYWVMRNPSSKKSAAPAAAAAKAVEQFGKELKLEQAGKFDHPERAMDMKADADGTVYVLADRVIRVFKAEKLVKTLDLKAGAAARSMAYDGKNFYVTDYNNAWVIKVDKDSGSVSGFEVPGAARLLGIAYSRANNSLYAIDVHGKVIFNLDTAGHVKGKFPGPNPEDGPNGFALDLQIDPAGGFYVTDQIQNSISYIGADKKLQRTMRGPWSNGAYERAGLVKDKLYFASLRDRRVVVLDTQFKPVGFYPVNEELFMMCAGQDGFLYLQAGARILKLKALDSAAAPEKAAAPQSVTETSAAKK